MYAQRVRDRICGSDVVQISFMFIIKSWELNDLNQVSVLASDINLWKNKYRKDLLSCVPMPAFKS